MLGETGVPNPLFDLITIYDEEKSSEVSLLALISITEKKEHEKAYVPSLDAPFQNLPQSEHEVKSVLYNKLLDLLETQKDISRDELG
jgi:hypothetical protein